MQVREYLPGLASTTSAGWASRLKSQGIVVPHLVQRPPAVQGRRADAADKTLRSSSGKFSLAQRKLVLFYLALQPIGCGRTHYEAQSAVLSKCINFSANLIQNSLTETPE